MKKSLIFVGMLAIGYANAQEGNVGINTDQPKATLDIQPNATNLVGTTNEGILAPRLSKVRVANIEAPVQGTLVYVLDENSTEYPNSLISAYTGADAKVAKITEKGYYFYNGTEWVRVHYKDTNDAEWIYDNATKRINLKRSGTGDFSSKVFYEKNGGLKSVDFGINRTSNAGVFTYNYNNQATFNYFEPYNALIKQASNLNTNNTLRRYMDYRALVFDNVANNVGYTGLAMSMTQKQGETTSLGQIVGIGNAIHMENGGNQNGVVGISNNVDIFGADMVLSDNLVGYTGRVTNATATKVEEMRGSTVDVILQKNASANFLRGSIQYITFNANTGSSGEAIVNNSHSTFMNNSTPTLERFYLYKGSYYKDNTSSMSNIKTAYGLYLDDIDFASTDGTSAGKLKSNYAIYTNKGQIRIGELADTSATADRTVVVDKDGVLKVGNTTATNGVQNTTNMKCEEATRGVMNFVKDVTIGTGKGDAFAVCLKGTDGKFYWRYLYGASGTTNSTENFGTGLQ